MYWEKERFSFKYLKLSTELRHTCENNIYGIIQKHFKKIWLRFLRKFESSLVLGGCAYPNL